MRWIIALAFVVSAAAEDFVVFREPGTAPGEQLTRFLNSIAFQQLDDRARAVAAIDSRETALARQKIVREKILRLIGGLPEYRGPLNVQNLGSLDRGDYRVEKIIYDSLPGFHVTANVYVPANGVGPFPAILMPVGPRA
jgi:hypothetical protein